MIYIWWVPSGKPGLTDGASISLLGHQPAKFSWWKLVPIFDVALSASRFEYRPGESRSGSKSRSGLIQPTARADLTRVQL